MAKLWHHHHHHHHRHLQQGEAEAASKVLTQTHDLMIVSEKNGMMLDRAKYTTPASQVPPAMPSHALGRQTTGLPLTSKCYHHGV